ncbi:hypothetical protein AALA90_17025 [Lachnospiraceae bacterium 38-10]
MNEKLEIVKSELNTTTEIKDIWENPVVKFLSQFIPIPTGADSAIGKAFEIHQRKKQEQLFEIIIEDDTITIDDVNDVDCIMEFAKTMEVVSRLIRNDKIKYLASLLKNSIKDKKRNIDEFEEWLSKFSTLSVREIELLNLLYETENQNMIKDNNGQMVFNRNESWKAFMNEAKSFYELNESDIISRMLGIMRTGFCICEWKANLSDTGIVVYTAPEYRNMLSKIQ